MQCINVSFFLFTSLSGTILCVNLGYFFSLNITFVFISFIQSIHFNWLYGGINKLCSMGLITNSIQWFLHSPLSPISRTHFLRFPSNSEAFASELLENLEEMYYRHCNLSNLQTYNGVLPVVEGYDRRLFLWHICHKNMTKL